MSVLPKLLAQEQVTLCQEEVLVVCSLLLRLATLTTPAMVFVSRLIPSLLDSPQQRSLASVQFQMVLDFETLMQQLAAVIITQFLVSALIRPT